MKILCRGKMPDGTDIVREEWNEDYDFMSYGSTVAAFPIAKESSDDPFGVKRGEEFRLEIDFETEEKAKEAFYSLEKGEKSLKDYADKFCHRENIKYI